MKRTTRQRHVALLIETSKAFGRGLLQGIARYTRTNGGWSIYVDEYGPDSRVPRWLHTWRGDGLIIRARNRATADTIARLQVPVVDTLQQVPDLPFAGVFTDDEAIGRLAADHLIERRLHHFAFVGVERANWSMRRRDAFVNALRRKGFGCTVYSPISRRRFNESWEGGQEDLADWLEELPKPLGLMAAHDMRALCAFDACRRKNLAVPEQIAIVGVDNDDVMCQLADPPLTSIAHHTERIGHEAAALLDRLMAGATLPRLPTVIPPLGLMTRRSTDLVAAVEDPIIAMALRYLRDFAGSGMDVEKLAAHVGLSRRALERGFARFVGKTPHEQIVSEQIQRTQQLLRDTDYSLETIAAKIGVSGAAYLSVFFKENTGQTPGEYRKCARQATLSTSYYPRG